MDLPERYYQLLDCRKVCSQGHVDILAEIHKRFPKCLEWEPIRDNFPLPILEFIFEKEPDRIRRHSFTGKEPIECLKFLHSKGCEYQRWDNGKLTPFENLKYLHEVLKIDIRSSRCTPDVFMDLEKYRYLEELINIDSHQTIRNISPEVIEQMLETFSITEVICLALPRCPLETLDHLFVQTEERDILMSKAAANRDDFQEIVERYNLPLDTSLYRAHLYRYLIITKNILPQNNEQIFSLMSLGSQFIDVLDHISRSIPITHAMINECEELGTNKEWLDEVRARFCASFTPVKGEVKYPGVCMVCHEECDESIYTCGHPLHVTCFEHSIDRCPLCRKNANRA